MATFRWRGDGAGTKTDFNDGRNWVNEAGTAYAQARYPGSESGTEDDVYFDAAVAAAANACITKTDFSNGTDYAGGAAILRSVRVSADYNQELGASAKYFKANIRELVFEGTNCAHAYISGWTTGYAAGIGKMTVTDALDLKLDGTITNPTFLKGTIACAASMTIAGTFTIGYVTTASTDVTLTMGSGMTIPSTINVSGGTVTNSTAVTTLNISAGTWTQSAGNITTLTLNGGTCNWNDGNITTAYIYSGTLTGANGPSPRRIGTAYVYSDGTLNINNGQDNILVTSYMQSFGGTIVTSEGYQKAPYPTTTYAGTSDAKVGISPQTLNNSNVYSDVVYCAPQDRIDFYCTCGAIDAGGEVVFHVEESDATGGTYDDIAGKTVTFDDADDNKTFLIQVWGHELQAAHPFLKINAKENNTHNALVCAVILKNTF